MKKIIQKFTSLIVASMMGLSLLPATFSVTPVYADNADAAILTGCAGAENGHGEGIKCVVLLVVNILSVLVGVVGVIGIVIVGIQYLTAGGNEEQTRKAKRRLFEIVIGLVAYVLIAALLNWLLPGLNATDNSTSSITTNATDNIAFITTNATDNIPLITSIGA